MVGRGHAAAGGGQAAFAPTTDDADTSVRQLDRLLSGLTRLLTRLAQEQTVVLVLEDLHVADADSVALYGLLARQLASSAVVFLLTLRPGHAASADLEQFVDRLAGEDRAAVVDLEPLGPSAVAELVAHTLARAPEPVLVEAVVAQSGGNPFFVKELARRLGEGPGSAGGPIGVVDGAAGWSGVDRTALLGRFLAGDPEAMRLARTMAIFGRLSLAHLPLLEHLTGLGRAPIAACFDRLVARQLLVADGVGGYDFAHPILKEALRDDLGDAERHLLHRAVAQLLLDRRRDGLEIDRFELASHVAESPEPGDELGWTSAIDAADWAMGHAPLAAARWYAQAATSVSARDPRVTAARASEVYALLIGSETRQAVDAGRAALGGVFDGHDPRPLRFGLANSLYANDQLAEALAVVEADLSTAPATLSLRALQVTLCAQLGRSAEAERRYRDAVALVPAGQDLPIEELSGLSQLLAYASMTGRREERDRFEGTMRRLLETVPPSVRAEFHHFLCVLRGLDGGDLTSARPDFEAAKRLRGGVGGASAGGNAEMAELTITWLGGHWAEAIEVARSSVAALDLRGSAASVRSLRAIAGLILTDQGASTSAFPLDDDDLAGPCTTRPMVAVVRARQEVVAGRPDAAADLLRRQVTFAEGAGLANMASLVTEELVLVELGRGEPDAAAAVARAALDRVTPLGLPFLDVFALRGAALALGDRDAAMRATQVAAAEGLVVEEAKCRLVTGELGVDAAANLAAAHEVFGAVGASPWRRRAAAALRDRGLPVPRADRREGALTETEVELVRLVVDGLTNRAIAALMHYSAKTVEVYLSRIYAKVGCHGRVELTRAVLEGTISLDDEEGAAS